MRWLSDDAVGRLRAAAEKPDPGERYEVLERIGRGGMGSVWRAHDRELDREVALKVLDSPAPGDAARERMRREARILARLEHPGIVPVHDVGTLEDGRVWYAMKFVQGKRLDEVTGAGRGEKLGLFLRVCEAVAFAHSRGVIHRDLKPENVMVGAFGEVLVLDWGVAKILGDAAEAAGAVEAGETRAGTRPGVVVGTAGWMAPEQAAGHSHAVDPRADVWSLGALLVYLAEPEKEMPRPLRSIARRAMADEAAERYAGTAEVATEVRSYLAGEPVAAHPESLGERAARLFRRHQTAILLLLAYVAVRISMILWAGA